MIVCVLNTRTHEAFTLGFRTSVYAKEVLIEWGGSFDILDVVNNGLSSFFFKYNFSDMKSTEPHMYIGNVHDGLSH